MKTLTAVISCYISLCSIGLSQEITPSTTHQIQVAKTEVSKSMTLQIQGSDLTIHQYFHQTRDENTIVLHDKICNEGVINIINQTLFVDLCEYHITIDAEYLTLEPQNEVRIVSNEPSYNILFSSKKEYAIINSKSIIHRYFIDAGDLSIVPHKTFCGEVGGSIISIVHNKSKIEFTSLYDVTIVEMDSDNDGVKELFIIEDKGCADVFSVYQIARNQENQNNTL